MTAARSGRPLGLLVVIFLLSRAALFAAGWAGPRILGSGAAAQPGNVQRGWTGPEALEMWARWDAEWYLLIAGRGYHIEDDLAGRQVSYRPADATGFFPLYPILVRGVAAAVRRLPFIASLRVTSTAAGERPPDGAAALLVAGVLVSNAALFGALLLLFGRVRDVPDALPRPGAGGAPGRAALLACLALLCFPPSLFLSAIYAESLLLFLGLLCFELLRRRRWTAAMLVGALASATKPSGILMVLPAAIASAGAGSRGEDPDAFRTIYRWMLVPLHASGAAIFSAYCGREFGDPLSWLHRQERWRGAISWPGRAFARWWEDPQIHGAHGSTVEVVLASLALVLLAAAFLRRPLAESAYAAAVVLPPLGSTVWSFGRLSLQAFPLFAVLGAWAARRPALSLAYFVPGAAGTLALMAYYAGWWWAG